MSNSGSSSKLRLLSDLQQIQKDPPEGITASPESDNDLYVWNATITGYVFLKFGKLQTSLQSYGFNLGRWYLLPPINIPN